MRPAVFPQLPWALGAPDVAYGSFQMGLLCTLLASPAAQLLSLLLRLGQVPAARLPGPAVPGPPSLRDPCLNSHLLPQEPSGPRQVKPRLPPRRAPMGAAQGRCAFKKA